MILNCDAVIQCSGNQWLRRQMKRRSFVLGRRGRAGACGLGRDGDERASDAAQRSALGGAAVLPAAGGRFPVPA